MVFVVVGTHVRYRELHVFRGHQPSPTGFIMGHEFTGIVFEVGNEVKSVKVGDKIVSPFTVSWYIPAAYIAIIKSDVTHSASTVSTARTIIHRAVRRSNSSGQPPSTVPKPNTCASPLPMEL